MLVGDNLAFDAGDDGVVTVLRGSEGADIVFMTCGIVSSRLRLRFEGRYCIHRGNCLDPWVLRVGVVGVGRLVVAVGVGVGATASTARRQNLQRGGVVSAIPLESPVQAGGVSGAFHHQD